MKIGFLIQPWDSGCPPNPGGSIGQWTWEVARRLAPSCEALVCGPRHDGQPPFESWEKVRVARIPLKLDRQLLAVSKRLHQFRGARRLAAASGLYYGPYALRAGRIFRNYACDVIHIHNFSQFVPLVRRFNPRASIVLHMHCDWLVQFDARLIERRIRHADLIMGNSDYVTARIRRQFPEHAVRCVTVFNGVDVDAFRPAVNRAKGGCDRERIVYVGRISPEKGLHVLLDAFEQVLTRRPNARLALVGGAQTVPKEYIVDLAEDPRVRNLDRFYGRESYVEFLRERVRGPLKQRVSFEGELSHDALAKLLTETSVLVLPSLVETFGLPIIEAMAAELPVVASRIGGIPEIVVEGQTGLLVEPDSPAELAQTLLRILDDPVLAEAMGRAGRKRAEELFSWDRVVRSLNDHYENLCGQQRNASAGVADLRGMRNTISSSPPTAAGRS